MRKCNVICTICMICLYRYPRFSVSTLIYLSMSDEKYSVLQSSKPWPSTRTQRRGHCVRVVSLASQYQSPRAVHEKGAGYRDLCTPKIVLRMRIILGMTPSIIEGLKVLSRAMSHHGKGERPCHLWDTENSLKEETLRDHVLTSH